MYTPCVSWLIGVNVFSRVFLKHCSDFFNFKNEQTSFFLEQCLVYGGTGKYREFLHSTHPSLLSALACVYILH